MDGKRLKLSEIVLGLFSLFVLMAIGWDFIRKSWNYAWAIVANF